MSNKIKWGVIGCGGIARRRTIPGMMLSDNCQLVAVMDTNKQFCDEVAGEFNAKPCYTVDELLSQDIEAVYIATPVFCHKEQVIAAVNAKKHILLEKPMGLTVKESEEIIKICREGGVKLGVGLMMRFSAYHQKMRELIKGGAIGDIVSMRAQLTCWYPDIEGNWRQNKETSGGGALMDMGIHCIDLLQYITGLRAKTVAGFCDTITFNYSSEDSGAMLVKMENGATAFVDSNFNIPDNAAKCRIEFYGTGGSILAEGTISQVESGEIELTTSDSGAGYDAKQNRDSDDKLSVEVTPGNMYEKEITSFGNAIINDTDPEITGEDGLFVQKIIESAYKSSDTHTFINL